MINNWDDVKEICDLSVEHYLLTVEIWDLAKEYHKTKAIPVATELADKMYRLMTIDGVVNEKS